MEEDNYLHAGKELEMMHGLYWYDNGKRWYDPILARFTTMDPLCEKYTTIRIRMLIAGITR